MQTRSLRSTLIGILLAVAALALPAAAGAASTGSAASSASCANPGNKTIQSTIEAASSGATLHICPGTYTEQLVIEKPIGLVAGGGPGSVKVVLPASPQDSKTPCDTAKGTENFQADQDGVAICTAGEVKISGLTFEFNWPANTCYDSLYGILVGGGATLRAKGMTIDGAGADPINGCQGGIGIQVGMSWTEPVEVGHANLSHDKITGYQKNGMTIDGAGSTASIKHVEIVGAGPTPEIAQNGIQVSFGGQATIKGVTISGNECNNLTCGPDALDQYQSTGVLFYGGGAGSTLEKSTLRGNDIGAAYLSLSPTQPKSPEVTIAKDVLAGNRYEGIVLDQGDALLQKDTITGPANAGIDLETFEGEPYAPDSEAQKMTIEGMTHSAIEVLSDKAAGDPAGSFTISKSSISKNAKEVENESTNFTVNKVSDH